MASSSSLPTGQHGLCFGYCFSGQLPLRSHFNSPPFGVSFRESLVLIDYTQKSTRSTLALKLSAAPPICPWVTATRSEGGNVLGTVCPSVHLSVRLLVTTQGLGFAECCKVQRKLPVRGVCLCVEQSRGCG